MTSSCCCCHHCSILLPPVSCHSRVSRAVVSRRRRPSNCRPMSSLQYPPPTRVVPLPRSRIKSNTSSNIHPCCRCIVLYCMVLSSLYCRHSILDRIISSSSYHHHILDCILSSSYYHRIGKDYCHRIIINSSIHRYDIRRHHHHHRPICCCTIIQLHSAARSLPWTWTTNRTLVRQQQHCCSHILIYR